jgi:hypothetical protein
MEGTLPCLGEHRAELLLQPLESLVGSWAGMTDFTRETT